MTDELYVDLLHEEEKLTHKRANKLWSMICERSDGVDVPKLRTEIGLLNKPTERYRIINKQRYIAKSKLGTFNWDRKEFQIKYMWGIPIETNEMMRKGLNNHSIVEILPGYISKDELCKQFVETKSVMEYITNLSKEIMTDSISNATSKEFPSFQKAIEIFEKSERDEYKFAIQKISESYQRRLKHLMTMYPFDEAYSYLIPLYQELILWNTNWCNGVIDAVFQLPNGSVKPVDYKFGKPKDKYYMESIGLEMTFYKKLLMSYDATTAPDFRTKPVDRTPWKPLYTSKGEMWYVLGGKEGVINIQFSEKWDTLYWDNIFDYWDSMNSQNYDYQPTFGWEGDRYSTYCPADVCDFRKICERSRSFKMANSTDDEYMESILEIL